MASAACSLGFPAWYAVRTKPSQEKRAAENLTAWGIETLTPWLAARRALPARCPLFPSYIFARFNAAVLPKVNFTRGVSYVVSFGGKLVAVDEAVIATIHDRMDEKGIIRNTQTLKPGDAVRILAGPLRDFTGVLEKKMPGSERVRVLLTTVAYSARVEMSIFELAKLAPNAGE
jgi:transcriptional antiterminator RfaH